MAIRYEIEKHTSAYPTKMLASNGGKHIYNVLADTDTDNGYFVARGDLIELDLYAEAAASEFEGKVVLQAQNGNFYVEVVNPGNALFVYNVPLIEEDFTNTFKKESNYFNAAGSILRAYEPAVGDIVEISAEGFEGEATVGATINGITGKKATIA